MLFEVPYNFDEAIIPFYKKYASYINYLYLPPYKDDLDNTRSSIQTQTKGHCYMPQSREEYENHLQLVVNAGLKFVVLWQVSDNIIQEKTLKYYYHHGSSGFIVANDKNAEIIKHFNPNFLVICSVVQRVCTEILKKDLTFYDYVILYYPFNRALNALKKLRHIKDKIILMPNTLCNVDCPSIHHWFPQKNQKFVCWTTPNTLDKCGLIFPEHLEMFDDYVAGYKLQGREYSSEAIKYLCHFYFFRTEYENFVDPFLNKDMAKQIKDLVRNTPSEIYYNTETAKISKYLDSIDQSIAL